MAAFTRWMVAVLAGVALGACQDAVDAPVAQAAPLQYEERIVGAATATAALPMIVAIHGLGDRPESFGALLEGLDVPVRLVLPRGPGTFEEGHSWFAVRFKDGKAEVLAEEVAKAADRVAALIGEVSRKRPTRGKPIVLGFSQGGMITFALAVRHPKLVHVALPIGGWISPGAIPSPERARSLPPIVAFHGVLDRGVPFDAVKEAVKVLAERGAKAELVADPKAGHEISVTMRARLFGVIRNHVAGM